MSRVHQIGCGVAVVLAIASRTAVLAQSQTPPVPGTTASTSTVPGSVPFTGQAALDSAATVAASDGTLTESGGNLGIGTLGDKLDMASTLTTVSTDRFFARPQPRTAIRFTFGQSVFTAAVNGTHMAASGTAYGVYGQSASTSGQGVHGWATATSGITYGGVFEGDSTGSTGVFGVATAAIGPTFGGSFTSNSASGTGVFGNAPATSGVTTGVKGESESDLGTGVLGIATAAGGPTFGGQFVSQGTSGKGVYGYATAASGPTIGVHGVAESPSGIGVAGGAGTTSGIGVRGLSHGSDSSGVVGINTAGSGTNYGGNFRSASTEGRGLFGYASAGTGLTIGVYGVNASVSGTGVYGEADATSGLNYGGYFQNASSAGVGVYGKATASSGTTYGVIGYSESPNGFAVFSDGTAFVNGKAFLNGDAEVFGNLSVHGNLSKSTGSFKIDHPLEPADKYLSHSFVESPDMMNIYNGNAVLDQRGEAWVELPEWFESLNRDFRYQLTAIGGPGPNLYVAEKVHGNRFQIGGGQSGLEVSWQVTGVRQDPYAEAHRIKVEEDKPADERGYYLHPEEYGQPKEQGINYVHGGPLRAPVPPIPNAAPREATTASPRSYR